MFKFKEIVNKITEKSENAVIALTKKLVHREHRELVSSKSIADLKQASMPSPYRAIPSRNLPTSPQRKNS